jgi:hypothetical protein
VTEREIENKYTIPAYFNIKESKRVAVETLDMIMFSSISEFCTIRVDCSWGAICFT